GPGEDADGGVRHGLRRVRAAGLRGPRARLPAQALRPRPPAAVPRPRTPPARTPARGRAGQEPAGARPGLQAGAEETGSPGREVRGPRFFRPPGRNRLDRSLWQLRPPAPQGAVISVPRDDEP